MGFEMSGASPFKPSLHPSIWAMIFLSELSERKLRAFCIGELKIPPRLVRNALHVTVYHARRPIDGISDLVEPVDITVSSSELRAMAMAPGGENPRADIDPTRTSVGIRIRRADGAASPIERLRARFLEFETKSVLGRRPPSTRRTSAFGARSYQPHLTLLRAGAIRDPDLSKFGAQLRSFLDELIFDRLIVRCRRSNRHEQRGG